MTDLSTADAELISQRRRALSMKYIAKLRGVTMGAVRADIERLRAAGLLPTARTNQPARNTGRLDKGIAPETVPPRLCCRLDCQKSFVPKTRFLFRCERCRNLVD